MQEVDAVNGSATNDEKVETFKRATRQDKSKWVNKGSPYTISSPAALKGLVQRQFLLKYAEPGKIYRKTFTNVSVALVVGSLFYGGGSEADDPTSAGAFKKGGALFFSLLFLVCSYAIKYILAAIAHILTFCRDGSSLLRSLKLSLVV